jgi:hypothetical protein
MEKYDTPFDAVMNELSDIQCHLCRYKLRDKLWYCEEGGTVAKGVNPCMKKEEMVCPVFRNSKG